jgi:tetratricopeptide (TPR) repeat protein
MVWIGRRALLAAMAAMALGASSLHAERPESPDVVCVIAPTADTWIGNRRVDTLHQGVALEVDERTNGWLWSNAMQGWVRARDVLPLNEAILWFGRELQKHPDSARLLRSRAQARFYKAARLRGDVASTVLFALDDVNRALRLDPNDVDALCLRGKIRIEIDSPEMACEDFERAVAIAPRRELPRLLRASVLIARDDYVAAEKDLAVALAQHPDSENGWLVRAAMHRAQKDVSAAIEDLNQAIRRNPYSFHAYWQRAQLQLERKQISSAFADAEIALRLDRHDAGAWGTHARCLAERGRHQLAVEHYTQAIELNPDKAEFYAYRGQSHFALRKKATPEDDGKAPIVSEASKSKPDSPKADDAKANALTLESLVQHDVGKWFGNATLNAAGSQDQAANDSQSKEADQDRKKPLQLRSDPHATAARSDFAEARRLAPENPELLAQFGLLLWKLSDPEAAIAVLDDSIAIRSETGWPYAVRGECRASQQDFGGAMSDFNRAVELAPEDYHVRCLRAKLRISMLDLCGAEDDARAALKTNPQSNTAELFVMVALELQGRSGEAFEFVRQCRNLTPDQRHERLAFLWVFEGEHDRVQRHLLQATPASSSQGWKLFGCNLLWAKEPKKIRECYDSAIQPMPDAPESVPMLRLDADLALRRGRVDQALAAYTDALENAPWNSRLWVRRARAYLRKHDLDRAAADVAQALWIDPQSSFALAARAELSIERGNLNAALDDCHAALRYDVESVEAYVQLARLWRMQGHVEQCLSDADTALNLNPYCAEASREQGFAWLARRDEHAACEAFQKCLGIEAVDAEAHFGIAEAGRILQHDEIAIQHYEAALARRPQWAAALGGRGLAWLHDGNQARAAADFEAALEIDPDELHALAGRGELRRLRGEYARAVDDLRHALRVNPDFTDACESLAWILAACPDGDLRDGEQAVALAKNAVHIRPTCDRLQALAAAYAEAGDFDAAKDAEKQALQVAPPFGRKEFDDRLALFANHQPVRLEVREPEEAETVPVPEAAPDAPFEP